MKVAIIRAVLIIFIFALSTYIYLKVNFIVKPYVIYYGNPSESKNEELMNYPVIILEPRNYSEDEIKRLKIKNSKVFGYVSFVEQNINNAEFDDIKDEWYYTPNNEKIKIDKWEAYYMDLSEEGYVAFLKDQVIKHIIDKGCDGLFIDTIGDIDEQNWSEDHKESMKIAYNKLLFDLKTEFDIEIIQNRGFDVFTEYSHENVDGIMWENFSFDLVKNDLWVKNHYDKLKAFKKDFYIVSEDESIKSIKFKHKGKLYFYNHENDIYD